MKQRIEKDFLGEKEIPEDALYGIHSMRSKENFPGHELFFAEWLEGIALTKLAVYKATLLFNQEVNKQFPQDQLPFKSPNEKQLQALIQAAEEVSQGKHYEAFIVSGISGGAGTSLNMNANEIICNRALQILGFKPGQYDKLDPIESANIFQSTNDVIPTSLRVTILKLLPKLEEQINESRKTLEALENKYRHTLRPAFTQMQQAVPSSYGNIFGPYQEALSRDWWRLSKSAERLKVVNLGGSAIGTGITVPQFVIFRATEELRHITELPLSRSEQLCDATMNLDSLVEAHAILKSHAVNLEKISSDLRLLSSDLFIEKTLSIPPRQIGSSIMPGKVNPVICEYVISLAHAVYANDQIVTSLAAQGCLELNAYTPIIGHAFIDSLKKLTIANTSLNNYLLKGISINESDSEKKLLSSPTLTTILVPYLGYNKAAELAKLMKTEKINIVEANRKLSLVSEEKLLEILSPQNLLKLGYKISDIIKK